MSDGVSITALLEPISIVHIPLTDLAQHAETLYRTIDFAHDGSKEFFSITSNAIEVAVFASSSFISQEWHPSFCPSSSSVQISASSWRAFEIESSNLLKISRPLAKAGISILYTSSHFTDFLFVKAGEFERAVRILDEVDCEVDFADPDADGDGDGDSCEGGSARTDSAFMSSSTLSIERDGDARALKAPISDAVYFPGVSTPLSAPPLERHYPDSPPTCIPRRISEPAPAPASAQKVSMQSSVRSPAPCSTCATPVHILPSSSPSGSQAQGQLAPAPAAEITVLTAPLACVGLNKDSEDRWRDRIRRFLVYPARARRAASAASARGASSPGFSSTRQGQGQRQRPRPRSLVLTPTSPATRSQGTGPRPFISFTRTREGTSLTTEVAILRALFPGTRGEREEMLLCGGELKEVDVDVGIGSGSDADTSAEEEEREEEERVRVRRSERVPLLSLELGLERELDVKNQRALEYEHESEHEPAHGRGRSCARARARKNTTSASAEVSKVAHDPLRIIPVHWVGPPSPWPSLAQGGMRRRRRDRAFAKLG